MRRRQLHVRGPVARLGQQWWSTGGPRKASAPVSWFTETIALSMRIYFECAAAGPARSNAAGRQRCRADELRACGLGAAAPVGGRDRASPSARRNC